MNYNTFLKLNTMTAKDKLQKLADKLQDSIDFAIKHNEDLNACSWNYQEGVLLNHNEAKLVVDLVKNFNTSNVSDQSKQLRAFKQAQTKQCDIPVVVVQREQFVCKKCGAWTFTYRDSNGNPPKCKHCNGQTN